MERRLAPKIHARGDAAGLDAVLELVAFSARPRSLVVALGEMPGMIAAALRAQVCSIYLLEGDDLVMRGNVGFGAEALGNVRLGVGEGVTGMAVETMRPISLQTATAHASWRRFPGLGEERFPIFLAVPIPGATRPLGALVLQRRDRPAFTTPEIELAAALTAPIAAIVERARLADALAGRRGPSGAAGRRVTLSGRSLAKGQALGVVFNSPRPSRKELQGPPREPEATARALQAAVLAARRAVGSLERRMQERGEATGLLASLRMILDDHRLRERALDLAVPGRTLGEALQQVGAEAARAARRTGEAFGVDRAQRISEVCDALAFLCAGEHPPPPRKAVLACDALSAFDVVVALGPASPAAVVLAEPVAPGSLRSFLERLRIPVVAEVAGLLRWAADGERALVDGDHGLVSLNPKRSEVE
ncbi:MAG TPA: GAF domain-containing protein, partial [Myxococcales bacterium]|nr:GAF domain-containing protein [Myxococcales bacterium]